MDYGDSNDFKRSQALRSELDYPRQPVDQKPLDYSYRRRGRWHDFRMTLRLFMTFSVIVPMGMICGGGLAIALISEPNSTLRDSAIGLIAGGAATGLFSWSQAVAGEMSAGSKLRQRLGVTTDLSFSDFSETEVSDVYLRGRRLSGAKFSRSVFLDGDFTNAELVDARFTNGQFFGSTFEAADLTGAGMYEAKMKNCNFKDANLFRATLVRADLRSADLRGANLSGADLRGADLRDSRLSGAQFEQTWYGAETRWPLGFYADSVEGLYGVTDYQTDARHKVFEHEVLDVDHLEKLAAAASAEPAAKQ